MSSWDWTGVSGPSAPVDRPDTTDWSPERLRDLVRSQADEIDALRAIIELAPVGIGIVDMEGRAPLTNDALRLILGYSAEEFAAMSFSEFSHPEDDAENLRLFGLMRAGELDQFAMDKRFYRKDGRLVWTNLRVSLMRDSEGRPAYAIGMTRDITEHHRSEVERVAAEAQLRLLVERVPAVVYTAELGTEGRWHYVSPQIETLLGWTPQEWMDSPSLWWEAVLPEDRAAVLRSERSSAADTTGSSVSLAYRLRRRDGRVVWVRDDGLAAVGADGVVLVHGVLVDITEQKVLEQALADQAERDPLTGLWNRAHLRRAVDAALGAGRGPVGLLFVDLDGFKEVNDTLGHRLGDTVLSTVALRFSRCVRGDEVLARLGGDEFALLLTGATPDALTAIAERLLRALEEPFSGGGHVRRVGASIGAAIAGSDDSTDTLLHLADQAMYQAKAAGGGRVVMAEATDRGEPRP